MRGGRVDISACCQWFWTITLLHISSYAPHLLIWDLFTQGGVGSDSASTKANRAKKKKKICRICVFTRCLNQFFICIILHLSEIFFQTFFLLMKMLCFSVKIIELIQEKVISSVCLLLSSKKIKIHIKYTSLKKTAKKINYLLGMASHDVTYDVMLLVHWTNPSPRVT